MRIQIHDELHKCNALIVDIKTVIEASDKHMHELFKKHITLVCSCEERIKSLQNKIDGLIEKSELNHIDTHKSDPGSWP